MKKIFAFALAAVMLLTLAACGAKNPAPAAPTLAPNASLAQKVEFDFNSKMPFTGSMEELANALLENEVLDFAGMAMPVEEGWLTGFTSEITGFTDGAVFAPMIGSIPFVGYVFRTASEADAAALKDALTAAHDLRWNICTAADEMLCTAKGDTVFFIMAPTAFEE